MPPPAVNTSWDEDFKKALTKKTASSGRHVETTDIQEIIAWYAKSSARALNPTQLTGLDDSGRALFLYIISGLVESKLDDDEIHSIVESLKDFYSKADRDDETIIFDLMKEAIILSGRESIIFPERFTKYVDELNIHFSDNFLGRIQFYKWLGIQNKEESVFKQIEFIDALKQVLNKKTLEELANLDANNPSDGSISANSFKYQTKRVLAKVGIILCILNHVLDESYTVDPTAHELLINDLSSMILGLNNYYYTIINSKGLESPGMFFLNIYDYINKMTKIEEKTPPEAKLEILNKRGNLIRWFYKKFEQILKISEVTEIKTQECLYDLFDTLKQPLSENNDEDDDDEIRTFDFRTDTLIAGQTIIESILIPRNFWKEIDRSYCKEKNIPISFFNGILSEVTRLDVFYMLMKEELGADFIKNSTEVKPILRKIKSLLDENTGCAQIAAEVQPMDLKFGIGSYDLTKSEGKYLIHTTIFLINKIITDAYILNFTEQTNTMVNNLEQIVKNKLKILAVPSDLSTQTLGVYTKKDQRVFRTLNLIINQIMPGNKSTVPEYLDEKSDLSKLEITAVIKDIKTRLETPVKSWIKSKIEKPKALPEPNVVMTEVNSATEEEESDGKEEESDGKEEESDGEEEESDAEEEESDAEEEESDAEEDEADGENGQTAMQRAAQRELFDTW